MIRFRDLTLAGKAVIAGLAVLTVVIVIALASAWWDDLWDWLPWSDESRLERAEAAAETARSDASARRLEVEYLDKQRDDVAAAARVIIETRTVTERAIVEAEGAEDADVEIDAGRVDRLRDADRRLCELAPDLCAAAPQD